MRIYALRSNTVKQMENFLEDLFNLSDEQAAALREVEDAVNQALDQAHPVELMPQSSYIRRLQHQLVDRYGLASTSRGEEPYRRVVGLAILMVLATTLR